MKSRTSLFVLGVLGAFCLCGAASADWSEAAAVDAVNTGQQEGWPVLSFDGLTLYFGRRVSNVMRIYEATRSVPSGPFSSVREILGSTTHVVPGWVSPDNLRMYYHNEGGGGWVVKISQRASEDDPWPTGTDVSELNALGDIGDHCLTSDELTIVFTGNTLPGNMDVYDLWIASRPDRSSPFANVRNLSELNTDSWDINPYITPDGLTLYFGSKRTGTGRVYKASRSSVAQPFDDPEEVGIPGIPSASSPALSSDEKTLYFDCSDDIYVSYFEEDDQGLVGHWKFDDGEGSVAYDSAGNNDGTIYGATWTDGVLDGALDFDGVGDYVDCGNNDSLDITDEITISAWIKRPDFSTLGTIAGKTNGNSVTAGYVLFSHIEGLEFSFYSQGWKRTTPRVAVTANQWHHVAGTFNGNIAYLYVDGEQGASIGYNGAITVAAGYPVLIGYWRSQLTAYFNGQIDDVRIYDVALSAAEVLALYEPYRPGKTYHVDGLNGSDGWDGLTAETAFETIQKGIDTAQDRDTVAVWPWVYVERINFEGKAITVKSADYPAVIEAPWNDAVSFDSGEGPESALSNFVIRDSGTAVACSNASRPTLKNLTIIDNDLGIAAYDGSDPNITNCILWNNIDGDLFGCEAEYSLAEQDVTDPIAEAPLFADFDGGDYHLLSENGRYVPAYGLWAFDDETSPCVDGGDPGEDPFGERMPNGGRINMGAYGGTAYASMSEWPLTHDENKDGRTDFKDFASLCDEWLVELPWAAPPGTPAADRRPPEPDPATWDIEPYATSSSSILMAATAATDDNGVEYYFENTTIGGHASGWRASANWTDSSLTSSTEYCYRVKTRDKSPNANESGWSSTLCATTSSGGR